MLRAPAAGRHHAGQSDRAALAGTGKRSPRHGAECVVDGLPTLQGIALGDAGEPVAYWLHRIHPGASWLLPSGGRLTSERIPAADVLHIYRKRRPGQLRDVSWLAPVLGRLRDLGDYEAALLMKAKIEACLAAVVSEDGRVGKPWIDMTGVPGRD